MSRKRVDEARLLSAAERLLSGVVGEIPDVDAAASMVRRALSLLEQGGRVR